MEDRPWSRTPRETCCVCDEEMIEAFSYTRAKGRLTEPTDHIWMKLAIPYCQRCQPSWCWSRKRKVILYVPNTIYDRVASAGLAGRTAGAKETVSNSNMKLAARPLLSQRDLTKEGAWTAAVQMLLPQMVAASSSEPKRDDWCTQCCGMIGWGRDGMELMSYGWEMILPPGSPPQPKAPSPGSPPPASDTSTPPPCQSTTQEAMPHSHTDPCTAGSLAVALAAAEKDTSGSVGPTRGVYAVGSCPNGDCAPVGAKILPTLMDKRYFSSIRANVARGIKERIEDKEVPVSLTKEDESQIRKMVEALRTQAFGAEKIRHVAGSVLFGDLKSKKWSQARVEAGLRFLHERYSPEMTFSVAVKVEPMPHNKPPRILIADGDVGQIKSWLCIGILERLLFWHFADNSIKCGSKRDAMRKHEKDMRIAKTSVCVMENDGSAWDACCRLRLRELVEVPIIEYIIKILDEILLPENEWSHQRIKADKKAFLKLRFSPKIEHTHPTETYTQEEIECAAMNKPIFFKIDAIRRSGDRGTSCLNFLMNMVCWSWVLCGGSCCLMTKGRTTKIPLYNGAQATIKLKCEGDDSHVLSTYKFSKEELDDMEARWTRLGHRPKLFLRPSGSVTEFTGYHFLVDDHGIVPESGCPDIVRTMVASSVTIAKEAVRGTVDAGDTKIAPVACASLLCTAAAFADRMPSLAEFYLRVSREWMARGNLKHVELSHDHLMKLTPEVKDELFPETWKAQDATEKILKAGSKIGDVELEVVNRIASCDLKAEALHAEAKGVCSAKIWADVIQYHMDVNVDTDEQTYRQALRTLCGFDAAQGVAS